MARMCIWARWRPICRMWARPSGHWRKSCWRSARAKRAKWKRAFPKCIAGWAATIIDALNPRNNRINLAHVLVGSEGTLAYSTAITLQLSPVLGKRALGVCHFGSFHGAMDAAQHLVTLKPIAVELVDDTMLGLAAEIPMFHATLEAMLKGKPEAILLVEFDSGEEENAPPHEAAAPDDGRSGLRLQP